ncbi:STAS domain-containing protein [Kitasatospora sp. NPDC085879]|uniref:STAS domain-containing protein n=1 Tax=Kitasatospora sp. NPDC085879 TaxID=3154769 RepID=UPI000BB0CF0B|nr:STAS domain-containing protein [Streptomyces sp. TLI_235]PBC70064.1 anti-anti-sigma factor [Streptomyces sp. TLI_235]
MLHDLRGDGRVSLSRPTWGPVVCVFASDLHHSTDDQAQQALDKALGELPKVLAVDLSGVELLASGGLNALLRARTAAADRAVPMILIALSAGARRVLEITDTAALFPVEARPRTPPGTARMRPYPARRRCRAGQAPDSENSSALDRKPSCAPPLTPWSRTGVDWTSFPAGRRTV